MKKIFGLAALFAALASGLAFVGCSSGTDGLPVVIVTPGDSSSGGGTNNGGGQQTGGGQTTTPTPATYTITFNANDQSENPATATQTFTAGTPQNLKTIASLGFAKDGCHFAGWLTAPDATEARYADGAAYTATADATLYAKWSAIPVYSVNVPANARGTVTASPATATAGTEITLSASPLDGYEFVSFTVTDADSNVVTVTNGKFTMPAKNVTVTATFSAINYTVACGTFANGSVNASPATATIGQTVTLTISPDIGYALESITVKDAGGSAVTLSGSSNTRTFKMPAKNVTVNATFSVIPNAATGDYKKVGEVTIESTTYDIVTFGLWPQTIKASGVTVNKSVTETHGVFTYCKGSDGQWYVEQAEKANERGYKYSDGTTVGQVGTTTKWFKVEPIKWRVLTDSYGGNKLLLAESILTGGVHYYLSEDSRTIGGAKVYPNNYKYSRIRAWLNGSYESDDPKRGYGGKGFLQSAFTAAQQSAIPTTTVDNSARSTNTAANEKQWNSGENQYACDPTSDKIFLLSKQEVTTSAYGFADYDKYVGDSNGTTNSTRIRTTTDFAKATGAFQNSNAGLGGWWWLRSPSYDYRNNARDVYYDGNAYRSNYVYYSSGGVVPALCLSN